MPPAPRGSVGPGYVRPAPELPCRCPCSRRTSCGHARRGGASSSVSPSRCRPRPTTRRPPRPVGSPHAGSRVSARVPVWPRCPCCPARVLLGGAAVPCRSRPGPARMSGCEPGARTCRPRCRAIRRRTNPPLTRCRLDLGLHGLGLPGSAGGLSDPRTHRRPPATCRRSYPRRPSPEPAPSAWPVPCPSLALSLFRAPFPERGSHSSARAPAAPPVRALGRGSLVRPTGRSAVGRSGGARSQPAPVAARPRSLDPSLLPSLGARGRSGSGENGCGHAVLSDGCSIAHATTSAARWAEDLLVQPFVHVRGRAALPGDPLWDRRRVARHLNSLLPPSRAARVGCRPDWGTSVRPRITVASVNRRSSGRITAGHQVSVPNGLPFRPASCSL